MKVREIIKPGVVTVDPAATVAEMARLMLDYNLAGLPVVDGEGRLLGMVTTTDLVAKHARVHLPLYFSILGTVLPIDRHRTETDVRHALAVTARDLMEEDVTTILPDAAVDDAATLMVEQRINPIAVVEDDRLVGIISHADVIQLLLVEEGDGDQIAAQT